MGSYLYLEIFVIVFGLSAMTSMINKRVLGLPAVINAFYHNPNEPTEGFAGWYQRLMHKMNRSGEKYVITTGPDGEEDIVAYNPTKPIDEISVTESDDKF